MPRMAPYNASMVMGIHLAAASNGHFARPGLHTHQRRGVVMLVLVGKLFAGVLILHRPLEDFLSLRFLGGQPQPLQRMNHRIVETITGRVLDREAHQERNL